jgi:hypothetical protein
MKMSETRVLLKLLALGKQDIDGGRTKSARAVIARLRAKTLARRAP